MKTLRFFAFTLFLSLISCVNEEFNLENGENLDPHAISVAEALCELQSVLDVIEPQTRSDFQRTIDLVETVACSDVSPVSTRAGVPETNGNLVHIVTFKEGGYAVLGADDRLPSVIAVVEKGTLTAEKYIELAINGVDENAIDNYHIFPDILINKISDLNFDKKDPGIIIDPTILNGMSTSPSWVTTITVPTLLKTRWNQGAPYNMYTPVKNGQHCPAGCVAIALAQIMTFFAYEKNIQHE